MCCCQEGGNCPEESMSGDGAQTCTDTPQSILSVPVEFKGGPSLPTQLS